VAVTVAWALLLLGLGYLSMRRDEPTVREQRTVAQAGPVVGRAIGELVAAAGPDAVLELGEPRVVAGCRVSVFSDGATLRRSVTIHTAPERGPDLLTGIAGRLPADYRAGTRPGPDGAARDLRADAGEFVAVRGGVVESGVLILTAETGCRPVGGESVDAEPLPGLPVDDEPGRVLAALGATDPTPADRVEAPCPDGGAVYTARATGLADPAARSPAEALTDLGGTLAVVDRPDLYAYRDGAYSVVIEVVAGDVRVAVTTACPR
jgi:hypothetical protein